jgi:hypothetical protein
MAQRITFEFDTRPYEFAHGRAPKGYGCWAFQLRTHGLPRPEPVWAPSSTYGEAKRWFRNHVRTIAPADYCGHVEVEVCT